MEAVGKAAQSGDLATTRGSCTVLAQAGADLTRAMPTPDPGLTKAFSDAASNLVQYGNACINGIDHVSKSEVDAAAPYLKAATDALNEAGRIEQQYA
jgi:hypothetical protein